jgi:hypothetical protein
MHNPRRRFVAVGAAVLAASPLWAAPVAATGTTVHCYVMLTGRVSPAGELDHTPMRCLGTYAEVVTAIQSGGAGRTANAGAPAPATPATSSSFVIGTHYDGHGFTGSSFSVGGSSCIGGWLNTPSGWNDRISSTINGCYRVRHWENANLGGSAFDTLGAGGDITGYMDNRTSSIQYYGS